MNSDGYRRERSETGYFEVSVPMEKRKAPKESYIQAITIAKVFFYAEDIVVQFEANSSTLFEAQNDTISSRSIV